MKMRKVAVTLLAAFIVLSLAACAGGNEPAETGSANSYQSGTNNTVTDDSSPTDSSTKNDKEQLGGAATVPSGESEPADESKLNGSNDEEEEQAVMRLMIGDTEVSVTWEDNESVEALKELCAKNPLVIQMSMYGGFEQVGSIGHSLPKNDVQLTTDAGDIVLYSGDQIVLFYGSNSWAYTRLGHISDKSASEMEDILGNGDVTITISKGTAE